MTPELREWIAELEARATGADEGDGWRLTELGKQAREIARTRLALLRRLAAAVAASEGWVLVPRERIARIIDPGAFEDVAHSRARSIEPFRQRALDKASDILALRASPVSEALEDVRRSAWALCDDTEGTVHVDEFGEHYRVPKASWDRLAAAIEAHEAMIAASPSPGLGGRGREDV